MCQVGRWLPLETSNQCLCNVLGIEGQSGHCWVQDPQIVGRIHLQETLGGHVMTKCRDIRGHNDPFHSGFGVQRSNNKRGLLETTQAPGLTPVNDPSMSWIAQAVG